MYVRDKNLPHLGGNKKGGNSQTFTPKVWNYLLQQFEVKTVLDVGCGEGYSAEWFMFNGCDVIAIDGLEGNVIVASSKNIKAVIVDLTKNAFHKEVDLVWCCEVLEHIDETYLGNIFETLSSGKIVAITHGLPGQRGYHHVNNQPPQYWLDLFKKNGFIYLESESLRARQLSEGVYFQRTGMIFKRI
jgi:SAM-dependent methyltransferase